MPRETTFSAKRGPARQRLADLIDPSHRLVLLAAVIGWAGVGVRFGPLIGHMKSDGRLSGNFVEGSEGDAMNVRLCGAGHNIRKILRQRALQAFRRAA